MRIDEYHARNVPDGEQADALTEAVIGAMIEVHRVLGPGLTEIMYDTALCHELELRGVQCARQVPVAVEYKGRPIGETRLDLLVEGRLIVGLKACESLTPVHQAQVICYLRATKLKVALLVNLNVAILRMVSSGSYSHKNSAAVSASRRLGGCI